MSLVSGVTQINPGGSTAYRSQSQADEAFDLEALLAGREAARSETGDKKDSSASAQSTDAAGRVEPAQTVTPAQAREILREVVAAAGNASLDALAGWHQIGRPSLLGSAYI